MHWLKSGRWALVLALLLASSLQTAQAQLLSVTVAGVDAQLDAFKYGLKLAGKEDMANQIDGLIGAFLQGEGFKGLDTKKPMGAYLNKFPENPTQPALVVFIPVSNEADFLAFLGRLNVTPSKAEKGIRSIGLPTGQQIYLSFKGNYAFVCLDEDELKNPADPAKIAAKFPANTLLRVHAGLSEIPKELKERFLSEMDKAIKLEQAKKEGESDVHYQGRLMGMKLPRQAIETLVRDSESLNVTVSLDQDKHRFMFDTTLTPKSGSALHTEMKAMNASQSQFTSLLESAPASLVYHGMMTETVRKDFDNLLDNILKKAISEEKSVMKKAVAEKIYQVLEPTLKDKNYELAMSMRVTGDNQPMTGLAALHVKNGKQIEELVKGLIVEMKEKERQAIQLDAEKVGDVNIHVINIPADDKGTKEMIEAFGAAKISLAFHNDAIVLGVGKQSQEEVKRVLNALGQTGKVNPSTVQLVVHVKPFAKFIKEAPVRKAFETIFTTPDSDEVKVSVTGGDQLRWSFEASTQFLKLIEAAEKAKGE